LGPAALRFYVSPSQKPSSGPLKYEYYYHGYGCEQTVVHGIVMGHIVTIICEFGSIYMKKNICQAFFTLLFLTGVVRVVFSDILRGVVYLHRHGVSRGCALEVAFIDSTPG